MSRVSGDRACGCGLNERADAITDMHPITFGSGKSTGIEAGVYLLRTHIRQLGPKKIPRSWSHFRTCQY